VGSLGLDAGPTAAPRPAFRWRLTRQIADARGAQQRRTLMGLATATYINMASVRTAVPRGSAWPAAAAAGEEEAAAVVAESGRRPSPRHRPRSPTA
jgi:hypothetical protein